MKQVVCAVIGQLDEQVLLARRAPGEKLEGLWELPGGKVEEGESFASALERELEEELGLRGTAGEEIARSVYHYEHGSIELIALATTVKNEILRMTVHDAVQWITASDVRDFSIAPADVPLLDIIFKRGSE